MKKVLRKAFELPVADVIHRRSLVTSKLLLPLVCVYACVRAWNG